MFLQNGVMHRRLPRLQRMTTGRRWPVAVLFAGLLLSGQLLAHDHLHLDTSPDAPCWVCVHGDGTPLPVSAVALPGQSQAGVVQPAPPLLPVAVAPLRGPKHSRAPPRP